MSLYGHEMCNSDEKFTIRSNEYKNYLIAKDYKPKVVEQHFSEISKFSRTDPRQIKPKQQANDRGFFATTYNPMLPNMRSLIKKHLPVLHSDSDLNAIQDGLFGNAHGWGGAKKASLSLKSIKYILQ